jgi:SAM-dependent methyltransferase
VTNAGSGRRPLRGCATARRATGESEALYSELARFYDRIYHWKDYSEEARELLRIARRFAGRPRSVLDVACGTGRHLEFLGRGRAAAGVDLSPAMLREARRRLGPSAELRQGDMRTFRLGRRFDLVVCLFSAIGYMPTRRDRDRALANFFRHTAPGGAAIVEGWVRPSRWRDRSIHLQTYDGPDAKIARLSAARRLPGDLSRVDMQYLVLEPGRPIRHIAETHIQPLVEPPEMLGSFRRAGFRARVLLGSRWRDRGLYIGVRARDEPQRGSDPVRRSRRLASRGAEGR